MMSDTKQYDTLVSEPTQYQEFKLSEHYISNTNVTDMEPKLSLADLVQRQAQQVYYQAQTNERFHLQQPRNSVGSSQKEHEQ